MISTPTVLTVTGVVLLAVNIVVVKSSDVNDVDQAVAQAAVEAAAAVGS